MPIVASKSIHGITTARRKDDNSLFILSEQKYKNGTDEDMSEIAIEFYKIIYKKIFECNDLLKEGSILDEEGGLKNKSFAGDTMNSYKQISRRKGLTDGEKECWFNKYHCLANFWILPMDIGRGYMNGISKINVSKDYMDGFLKVLSENYEKYKELYPDYFIHNSIEGFYDMHYLVGSGYLGGYKNPIKITGLNPPKEVIDKMWSLIVKRAEHLSKTKEDELYQLFKNLSLIE